MSELVFTIVARDQASKVFNNVAQNSQRMGEGVKKSSTALSVAATMARGAAKAFKVLAVGAATATAAAGVVAVKVGKDVVTAATDMNETMSKSNTIFGKNAAAMLKWSENSAEALGMSQEAALAGAAQFGNFFDQIGIGGKQAVNMSKRLMQLSADLGSFNNAEPTEVMEAFQAATRGEYDTLQKFIPTANAAAVEIAALSATGKKSKKDLTVADKALGLYALANRDAGAAVGDFARTSGGLANQQRILAASFQDSKTKLGQALLPGVTSLAVAVNKYVIPAVNSLVAKHGPALSKWFTTIAGRIGFMSKMFAQGKWGDFAASFGRLGEMIYAVVFALKTGDTSGMGGQFNALGADVAKLAPVMGDLWTQIRAAKSELPSMNDVLTLFASGIGYLADHVDTLAKYLPYIVAGFVAYKIAQMGANVAALASVPLKVWEILQTRQLTAAMVAHTAALNANTVAMGGSLAATNAGIVSKIKDAWATYQAWLNLKLYQIQQRGGIQGIIMEYVHRLKLWAVRVKEAIQLKINAFWLRVEQINRQGGIIAIMRQRAAIIANTVAQKAQVVWTKVVTAATWAWNAAMAANPIGIVVVAIVALIAILVACWFKFKGFREFVTSAWESIKNAAISAWNWLQPVFRSIGDAALAVWNNGIKPFVGFVVSAWRFLFELVRGYVVNIWWPMMQRIGSAVMWVWNNAVRPAVNAIMAIWRFLFTLVRGYVVNIWWPMMQRIGATALWLWNNAIRPALNFIMAAWRLAFTVIRTLWNNVLKPTFEAIARVALWLWNNAIKPAITKIRDNWSIVMNAIRTVWNTVLKPTFDAVANAVNTVKDKFDSAINGIGRIWDRLKKLMSAPVKAVIDTVLNDGLIKGWNFIADKVLDGKYRITPDRIVFNGFATGGIMPGYTPGRDNSLIAVGGGEAIMRPEWTRAIGEDRINAWNAAARRGGVPAVARQLRIQGFADGGIFGGLKSVGSKIWDFAKTGVTGALDFLTNPTAYLKKMMSGPLSALDKFKNSTMGRLISDVPPRLINHVVNAAKSFVFGPNPADASGAGTAGTGTIASMQAWARQQAGKRYLWAAVGPNSYDCSGLAGNFYAMATDRPLYRRYFLANNPSMGSTPGLRRGPGKALTFLIGGQPGTGHMTTRINGMNAEAYGGNGTPLAIGRIGTPTSYFHTAWHVPGFARGGIPRKPNGLLEGALSWLRAGWPEPYLYDRGGILRPGATLAINNTGRNEYVTPPGAGRVGGSGTVTAPIVLKLDSRVVYNGLLKFKQSRGGDWELA